MIAPSGFKKQNLKIKESLDKLELALIFDENFDKAERYFKLINDATLNKTNKKQFAYLKSYYLMKRGKANESIELAEPLFNLAKEVNDFFYLLSASIPYTSSLYKIGKIDESLHIIQYIEKIIKDYLPINDYITKQKIASLKNVKGVVYFAKGEIVKANKSFEESLTIYTTLNDQKNMAMEYNNIGNIYVFLGDLKEAKMYLDKSLAIRKKLPNKLELASTLANLAEALLIEDKTQEALDYYLESLDYFIELEDVFFLAQLYFHLVYTYIKLENIDLAKRQYTKLINLYEKEKQKNKTYIDKLRDLETISPIKLYVDLSDAKLLKLSPRIMDQFEAGIVFRGISLRKDIDLSIRFKASLEYIEILFLELRLSNDENLIQEMSIYIMLLQNFAHSVKSVYIEIQLRQLLANIYLLSFQLEKCTALLKETILLAHKNDLFNYEVSATLLYDRITVQYDQWLNLKNTHAPITERLELLNIQKIITILKENKSAVVKEPDNEIPQLISIYNEHGLGLFSYSFANDEKNEEESSEINLQMITGFLTAINEFGKRLFNDTESGNIEQLKFKNSMILLKKAKNFNVSYLFSGHSYFALKKLNEFIKKISENTEIWSFLTQNSTPRITKNMTEKIGSLVEQVFFP